MITKTINILILLFIICFNHSFAYEISNNGKKLIKEYEKCSLIAYWDSNGYSIGYGHHKKYVRKGMKISKKQAEKLFNKDKIDFDLFDKMKEENSALKFEYKELQKKWTEARETGDQQKMKYDTMMALQEKQIKDLKKELDKSKKNEYNKSR